MLMSSSVPSLLTTCTIAVLLGCSSDTAGVDGISQDLGLLVPDVFGVTALPGKGCESAAHRQFDFWVGHWDVYAGETLVGTNVVERELDDCVVEENWTDPSGGRGRSLNVYDASVDRWSQMWSFSGGGFGAFVSLEGGLVNGTMHIEGSRLTPAGVEIFNTINWTPLPGGRVRQFGELRTGTGPLQQNFDIEYRPVTTVTPFAGTPRAACNSRATNREMDFALGSWSMHGGAADARPLGTVSFTTDLSGCLIEERLSGPKGYEGWSFSTWHTVTERWHRTYVDNRGFRLVLSGGREGNAMVLRGRHAAPAGGQVDVRVSWTPEGDSIVQRWETSADGGTSWQTAVRIVLTRNG